MNDLGEGFQSILQIKINIHRILCHTQSHNNNNNFFGVEAYLCISNTIIWIQIKM